MKVLFLSYYYKPDITAAAFRSTDFVNYLNKAGEDVRVITTYPHKSDNSSGETAKDDIILKRIALRSVKGRGFKNFLLHYLSFIPKSISHSIKWSSGGWKPDIIYISSPPIFIGITGIFLKYFLRRKLVLEVRDIWPDSAVAAGQLKANGLAYKLASYFERFLYRRSNGIVCVSSPMRDYIKQYYKPEITVAYNGPKKEAITVVNTKKAKLKNDEIRMAYAGNLGLVQGMDQLLEAFGKIRKSDLTNIWHLDIYGTGALEEELKSQSQKMGINENVHFHGALPKEILSTHLREADVLYLGLISSEALDKTIPSKLFDYLIFGKPILAAITGEGKDILENNQANLVLASCDSENIVNGIVKLDKSLNERSLLASGNIELLSGNYTREVNCQKIHQYLQEVIEK